MKAPHASCHPERPVRSNGLCAQCYRKQWRAKNLEQERERVRKRRAAARAVKPPRVARLPECHPDRKHEGRGLCKPCYRAIYYALTDGANRVPWAERPAKRAECHPERKHWARGLCQRCYLHSYYRAHDGLGRQRSREDPRILRARKNTKQRERYYQNLARSRARARAHAAKWRAENPESVRSATHKRRARLRDACSPGVTPTQWAAILAEHNHACVYCGDRGKLTRDHVIPVSRGGRDEPLNVVPACFSCNAQKGARTPEEYIAYLERITRLTEGKST